MVRLPHFLLIGLACLCLVACAPPAEPGATSPPAASTSLGDGALRAVAVTLAGYNQTQKLALQYATLPSCDLPKHPPLCRDTAVWRKIQAADRQATAAIVTANAVLNGGAGDPASLARATELISSTAALVASAFSKE